MRTTFADKIHTSYCFDSDFIPFKNKAMENLKEAAKNPSLTCIRGSAGVPDENASIVRRAGKDVVIDRINGQTVDGVDVQEHVESLSSAGESSR